VIEADRLGDRYWTRLAGSGLRRLAQLAGRQELPDLAALPADNQLDEEGWRVATAYAWDSLRYVLWSEGEAGLRALLAAASGATPETALAVGLGQSLPEFVAGWGASLGRWHVPQPWVTLADGFDPARALADVDQLAAPALRGRQAGSEGAAGAAAYIAAQFEAVGLLPAFTPSQSVSQTGAITPTLLVRRGTPSYFQPFPLQFMTLETAPRLALLDEAGEVLLELGYRQDFLDAFGSVTSVLTVFLGAIASISVISSRVMPAPYADASACVNRGVDKVSGLWSNGLVFLWW